MIGYCVTDQELFLSKIERSDCWIWKGAVNVKGYGRTTFRGKDAYAHRVAYELFKGPIPEGMTIDHLCRNHSCVNPAHLEAVPQRINLLRGQGLTAKHAQRTRCKRGHPLLGDNLVPSLLRLGRGRYCRTCFNEYHRNLMAKRRAAQA